MVIASACHGVKLFGEASDANLGMHLSGQHRLYRHPVCCSGYSDSRLLLQLLLPHLHFPRHLCLHLPKREILLLHWEQVYQHGIE